MAKISKIFFILSIVSGLLFTNVLRVEAHELANDGTIGVLFHSDPDDEAIANEPATLFFDFKDEDAKLNLNECDCTISITSSTSADYSSKLTEDSKTSITPLSITYQYVFPSPGTYSITVEGATKTALGFQSFKVSYDLPVSVGEGSSVPAPAHEATSGPAHMAALILGGHNLHVILFGAAILISIYIVIRDKRKMKS